MRTETEVEEFKAQAQDAYILRCKVCGGDDPACSCNVKFRIAVAAYEAGIPRLFWNKTSKNVRRNKSIFNGVVAPYVERLKKARLHGYGLLFVGDNGTGKTMFATYVLMEAIRKGYTAYYTTMPQLDWDIKAGFKEHKAEDRLNWLLSSDFVAIDEMGKERHGKNPNDTYLNTQVERILKQRCDDDMPLLLATNMNTNDLFEHYGPTVESMVGGKFQVAALTPGDYRKRLQKQMQKDMGYGE